MKRGKFVLAAVLVSLLLGGVATAASRTQAISFYAPKGAPLSLSRPEYAPVDQTRFPDLLSLEQYKNRLKAGEYTKPWVQVHLKRFSEEGGPPSLKIIPQYWLDVYCWGQTKQQEAVATCQRYDLMLSGELAIKPNSLMRVSGSQSLAKVVIGPRSLGEKPAKEEENRPGVWLAMYIIVAVVALFGLGNGVCQCCGK